MMKNEIGTVSYTHLDVYKRQVWSRGSLLDTPDDFDLTPLPATGNHWYYEKSNLRSLWYEQDCFNSGVGCGGSSDVVVAVIDTGLAFEDYTSVWSDIDPTPFDFDPAPDMFVGDSINPVSYTHLDVYKRQAMLIMTIMTFILYFLGSLYFKKNIKRIAEFI